ADGTLRCPWHHARFDVRTGEAVGAPAFNPLPCYQVELKDGTLVVRGKKDARKRPEAKGPSAEVIVGGCAAGHAAEDVLHLEGYLGPLTLLSADESVPYDRPNLSKDYLAGNAPEEWIPLRGREYYEEKRIVLKTGTRVTAISPKAHKVTCADGTVHSYGA